ncbi:MAG: hypothetical protein J3K34DRAFT_463891 [Monoraphidium minutum]|nr:MAG: hypothetical protein J3K34DRAFT_463891 [Monoraphidium minutum]
MLGLVLLMAPRGGHAQQPPAGAAVCKSLRLCGNPRGLAYASVDVFATLEPLLEPLRLGPVNDHVDVVELAAGCLGRAQPSDYGADSEAAAACCCDAPIEVRLALPAALPDGGGGAALAEATRAALGAAAGAATAGEGGDATAATLAPEAVPATADASAYQSAAGPSAGGAYGAAAGAYGSSYGSGGYGDSGRFGAYYGSIAAAATGTAVPLEAPAAAAAATSASLRPAARSLIAAAAPFPPAAALPPATCPPCPACAGAGASASVASLLHLGSSTSAAAAGEGSMGTCYCRYDAAAGAWALREPSCRAALEGRCGPAGGLLECGAVQAYYGASTRTAASADALSAYLFVDCPPPPPCGCAAAGALDGGRPAAAACCGELRAHCGTPFSGLDCDDVDDFCSARTAGGAAPDAVRQFVAVRTHNQACAAPAARRAGAGGAAGGGAGGAAALAGMAAAACVAAGAAAAGAAALVAAALTARRDARAPLLGGY